MPSTYAILGATGSTGSNLLRLLSSSPQNQINVYVRSRSKLEDMLPLIVKQDNVHIFEGSMEDRELIQRCISSVEVIFSVLASNTNSRDLSVAQDSARILVDSLHPIHERDPSTPLPRIIFLSSYSVSRSIEGQNQMVSWLVHKALCNVYGDLIKAETFLRKHQGWLKVVFVEPGVLSSDPVQRGHLLSTKDVGNTGFLSYIDLAAGMIEIAQSGDDKYDWIGVVVQPKTSAKFDWQAPYNLATGLGTYLWQSVY